MAITIKIRRFHFESDQDEGFKALLSECETRGIKPFEAMSHGENFPADGSTFNVDTSFLFSDQFSTEGVDGKSGLRLFDCRISCVYHNGRRDRTRYGYVLEADEGHAALQEARHNQLACGYCGARYDRETLDGKGPHWCGKCTGSEYLTPDVYKLLQLLPISAGSFPKRDKAVP